MNAAIEANSNVYQLKDKRKPFNAKNVKAPSNSHLNLCMNIYTFIQFECKLQITNSLQPNTKVFSIVMKVQNRGFDPKIGDFTFYIQL
jgi:hypothetical protein